MKIGLGRSVAVVVVVVDFKALLVVSVLKESGFKDVVDDKG